MSALTKYSNAFVYVDGNLLYQNAQVSVEKKSGLNMVETTAIGLAGACQGAARVEISIDNAVPLADFELGDFWDQAMKNATVHEIEIRMGSRSSKHNCFVTDATYSHSTNEHSKVGVKLTGQYALFES
jgi:hypothetical protein